METLIAVVIMFLSTSSEKIDSTTNPKETVSFDSKVIQVDQSKLDSVLSLIR